MAVDAVPDVAEPLRAVLVDHPEVVLACLFGSRAAGRARPDSDVDVAVLLRRPHERPLLELAADLGRAVAPLRVDVVDLQDAPVALAYRVLRGGVLLVDRDERVRRAHWVRVVDRHLDMAPARRVLREGTRRRLREGRFGRP